MKKLLLFLLALLVFCWCHPLFAQTSVKMGSSSQSITKSQTSSASNSDNLPNAVVPEKLYRFKSALDGDKVQHDFIVKNTGKGILKIAKVRTG